MKKSGLFLALAGGVGVLYLLNKTGGGTNPLSALLNAISELFGGAMSGINGIVSGNSGGGGGIVSGSSGGGGGIMGGGGITPVSGGTFNNVFYTPPTLYADTVNPAASMYDVSWNPDTVGQIGFAQVSLQTPTVGIGKVMTTPSGENYINTGWGYANYTPQFAQGIAGVATVDMATLTTALENKGFATAAQLAGMSPEQLYTYAGEVNAGVHGTLLTDVPTENRYKPS